MVLHKLYISKYRISKYILYICDRMILELERAEMKWFSSLMTRYSILMQSHVLNGTRLEDDMKAKIYEVVDMKIEKLNIISLGRSHVELFIEILEENFCSCPGCNLSSVKHRKKILAKLYTLLNDDGELYYE